MCDDYGAQSCNVAECNYDNGDCAGFPGTPTVAAPSMPPVLARRLQDAATSAISGVSTSCSALVTAFNSYVSLGAAYDSTCVASGTSFAASVTALAAYSCTVSRPRSPQQPRAQLRSLRCQPCAPLLRHAPRRCQPIAAARAAGRETDRATPRATWPRATSTTATAPLQPPTAPPAARAAGRETERATPRATWPRATSTTATARRRCNAPPVARAAGRETERATPDATSPRATSTTATASLPPHRLRAADRGQIRTHPSRLGAPWPTKRIPSRPPGV